MSRISRPAHGLALVPAELRADQLVAGADREHHRALGRRGGQPPVGAQPAGGQHLRQVLAAAQQVDVTLPGHRLVGVDLDGLDPDAAQPGPPLQDQQVAAVTVGAEQVRVDPDQAAGGWARGRVLPMALSLGQAARPTAVRICWNAV